MKKQVIAISLAAMTALSLMACSGQKSEGTASSDAKVESKDTKDGDLKETGKLVIYSPGV